MRRSTRLLLVALALLPSLPACNVNRMIDRMVPPGADARSREYLALIARGQPDSAYDRLVPTLRTADGQAALRQLADSLRGRSFDSMERIGVNVNDAAGVRHLNLSYQVHDARGWFVANVAHVGRPGDDMRTWMVEGVRYTPIPGELRAANAFTFAGRGARHYLWIVAMLAAFLVSVATALHVLMSRGMPRRWLWVIVALLGVGRFSLDWTSGAWTFAPLQFLLFGAGFMRPSEFAPWVLSFGLPVGAAVAEWKRRAWRRAVAQAPATAPAPAPPADPAATAP
jgi:hypothetical protein